MRQRLRFASWIVAVPALCTGCGSYTGVVPENGYNTTKVIYKKKEPKQPADATIIRVPTINPAEYPDELATLPEPRVWKKSMPIAFVGEVELFDDKTDGALLRVEISPILSDGRHGHKNVNQVVAHLKKGEPRIAYRLDWRAPYEAGRYYVAIKTIGPSLDINELDTFVEGEIEVR